jgi:pimeloyl-[acyl-carrier protein] synthase
MTLSDLALVPLQWRPVRVAAIQSLLLKERLQSGVALDPFAASFRDDPYPKLEELRRRDPVHRMETARGWLFTRYEDVSALLRDPNSSADRSPLAKSIDAAWRRHSQFQAMLESSLFGLDPPDHTRLRTLVTHAFTPRVVEQMRSTIEQIVDESLDEVEKRGQMDVVKDLGEPMPLRVICRLLGVPPEDHVLFRRWSTDLALGLDLALKRETIDNADRAVAEMKSYFRGLLKSREPGDDLLTALVAAEEQGDRLSEDELHAFCILLLVAGHETTTSLIGNGLLAILTSPGQLERLVADPTLVEAAVEEVLRFDAPAQMTSRVATKDMQLHGKRIRRGDLLLLSIAGANRDPERFADPDHLDVGREENRHLTFGLGPHYCVGAPLARLEGQIVFSRLVERFPRMQLIEDAPLQRRTAVSIRSLTSLPVRLG